MRIPLDYYRILGIPMQVTEEQLHQAYCDRSLQLPRREYSEFAIASRKQLLDVAYAVLSDAQKRAEYDACFQEKDRQEEAQTRSDNELSTLETKESPKSASDRIVPEIEVSLEQSLGALLILQDLGEYEQIVDLGYAYLKCSQEIASDRENPETLQALKSDLILTIALAYWELGREQWQRREYETAATLGTKGLELLERENLFASVQEEIRGEIYKLRPYRILELLALKENQVARRGKGLQLLQEMLHERYGIDGKGSDRSGLGIDECLLFIQQIRIYLSAKEQQELFEAEAQRPSAVGKYLAIYALIARGFAEKQPALLVRANELLIQLSERQDIHLEQAMCALLLGQTEAANQALEGSKEEEPLAFIREHSQGEPDLLRGLCIYGEYWLQTEVFSHFRDLVKRKASIKEYFADKEVQDYLEQLPTDVSSQEQHTEIDAQQPIGDTMAKNREGRPQNLSDRRIAKTFLSTFERDRTQYDGETREITRNSSGRTATLLAPKSPSYAQKKLNLRRYAEEPPEVSRERLVVTSYRQPTIESPTRRRRRRPSQPKNDRLDSHQRNVAGSTQRKKNRSRSSVLRNRLIVGVAATLGVVAVGWLWSQWSQENRSPEIALAGEQLTISLHRPPIDIPPVGAQEVSFSLDVLTQQGAEQVIQTWLAVKSEALGDKHQIEKLDSILTGASLSLWRDRAEKVKNGNEHRTYEHQMQVRSLKTDTQNPDRAIVDASVREITKYYQNGQLASGRSDDDQLVIRYELIRQQGQWLIQNSQVIN